MEELYGKLQKLVQDSQGDATKAQDGNKAACRRLRASMQALKDLAKEVRTSALALSKAA